MLGEVDDESANLVVCQMLYLSARGSQGRHPPVHQLARRLRDRRDERRGHRCATSPATSQTYCLGIAASMGATLLAAGTKGKRNALPHAEVMIHQVLGGIRGQATDIQIRTEHLLRTKKTMNRLLAEWTGQPLERVEKDTDRDNFLTAREAKDYGLVDNILEKMPLARLRLEGCRPAGPRASREWEDFPPPRRTRPGPSDRRHRPDRPAGSAPAGALLLLQGFRTMRWSVALYSGRGPRGLLVGLSRIRNSAMSSSRSSAPAKVTCSILKGELGRSEFHNGLLVRELQAVRGACPAPTASSNGPRSRTPCASLRLGRGTRGRPSDAPRRRRRPRGHGRAGRCRQPGHQGTGPPAHRGAGGLDRGAQDAPRHRTTSRPTSCAAAGRAACSTPGYKLTLPLEGLARHREAPRHAPTSR